MVRQVLIAFLLCAAMVGCAVARPADSNCREDRSAHTLERLIRRSAAIASSLSHLRSIRQRRWSSSYPLWRSLHKIQQRAMDISNLPPLPIPDEDHVQAAKEMNKDHAAMQQDLNTDLEGVQEEGFWHHRPFTFPELTKPVEENGVEQVEPEALGSWGSVVYGSGPGEPKEPQEPPEPQDSFQQGWGSFVEPFEKCSDDVVGQACTHNSDCQGCKAFHCSSSTRRCVAGSEPAQRFARFY